MINEIKKNIEIKLEKNFKDFSSEINKINTRRISSSLISSITVNFLDKKIKIGNLSRISSEDSFVFSIQVFEKSFVNLVEKSILTSGYGFTLVSKKKNLIVVRLPVLTEERRKELSKIVENYAEKFRIAIRENRRKANDEVKILLKNKKISKNDSFLAKKAIQNITNIFIKKINFKLKEKERELMRIN